LPLTKLRAFLDQNNVKYMLISHPIAHTTEGIAAKIHIPKRELAKTVMVLLDGRLTMAVVPASAMVGLTKLKRYVGADVTELAKESDFRDRFPDCEPGAMPPFGNLYGMNVFADQTLAFGREISFNACSHRELLRMNYADFRDLVKPALMPLAVPKANTVSV
jgi:Ala-tRNA(Pro) deacylase